MSIVVAAFLFWILALIIATDALILNKFGSKTTYNASMINSSIGADDDLTEHPNCQLLQVIGLMRHGIRYPGADDIETARGITKQFQVHGAESSLVDQLDTVVSRYMPISMDKELSITGAEEQLNLGSRIARRFSQLFSSAGYEDVSFLASSSTRAKESCMNFSKGFADSLGLNISRSIETRDDLLRFFDSCTKYTVQVRKNKTAVIEETLFRNMTDPGLNRNIAKYLNISELNLSSDEMDSMYKIAACEVAVIGSHHWTDLLSYSDLELLEYADDLQQYWKIGYGYPINYQQSCPLLVDIFHHMDDVVSGRRSKKGVFYFGHAETLLPLTSLLGLFKDGEPLRADNFDRQRQREFRGSRMSSFSANLGFALYKCHSTDSVALTPNDEHMVQVLYNEQPVQLPHVCASSMCSYKALREYYSQSIDHCDFTGTCMLATSAAVQRALANVFLFLSVIFLIWTPA